MDHHARTEHAIDPTTVIHKDDLPLVPDAERRRFFRLAGGLLLVTAATVALVSPLRAEEVTPRSKARAKPFGGRARRRDRQDWDDMEFIEQVKLQPRKSGRRLRYHNPVASSGSSHSKSSDSRNLDRSR